ncbi:protein-export chaperone SecB [Luteimonas aestuarii]|uniref:Protein-export protein SecB n=1 Tax=Luteimonas aestuarii TaxID=453837 RepID=A0A4R5TKE0_9GAMM|nr:protein-export chaperone SecB [Luteimonas aestuarii]TDK20323.1 protein-export chaperone SecB [Luteimonas aestuarii]
MSEQANNGAVAPAQPTGPQFSVEKIYVKDVSFESPKAPAVFNEQGQPQLNMNLNQRVQRLGDNVFEVVLGVTLTCTAGEGDGNTIYVAEVQQAGVFALAGFESNVADALLGTQCPNVLYPYARQMISDLIQAGGFAPFLLQPINFDALYAESLRQRDQQGEQRNDLSSNSETAGNA